MSYANDISYVGIRHRVTTYDIVYVERTMSYVRIVYHIVYAGPGRTMSYVISRHRVKEFDVGFCIDLES